MANSLLVASGGQTWYRRAVHGVQRGVRGTHQKAARRFLACFSRETSEHENEAGVKGMKRRKREWDGEMAHYAVVRTQALLGDAHRDAIFDLFFWPLSVASSAAVWPNCLLWLDQSFLGS